MLLALFAGLAALLAVSATEGDTPSPKWTVIMWLLGLFISATMVAVMVYKPESDVPVPVCPCACGVR